MILTKYVTASSMQIEVRTCEQAESLNLYLFLNNGLINA